MYNRQSTGSSIVPKVWACHTPTGSRAVLEKTFDGGEDVIVYSVKGRRLSATGNYRLAIRPAVTSCRARDCNWVISRLRLLLYHHLTVRRCMLHAVLSRTGDYVVFHFPSSKRLHFAEKGDCTVFALSMYDL